MNRPQRFVRSGSLLIACGVGLTALLIGIPADAAISVSRTIDQVQPRIVKVYGAGGIRGIKPYQTGLLVSDIGHIVTSWSAALDTEDLSVTLNDGRKFDATIIDLDPRLQIAVLKIEATELPHFNLDTEVEPPTVGQGILAFGNLYGVATGNEPVSVLHGCISAITNLSGRRGAFKTPYQGPIFVLDAMTNNPGAAGGALTNFQGHLIGLLGKELRNAENNVWLNFAIPVPEWKPTVDDILAGKQRAAEDPSATQKAADPWTLDQLGLRLITDVLPRTPPFVDRLETNSPAAAAGLQPDDLIVYVNDQLVQSCSQLTEVLARIDRFQPVTITLLRGDEELHVVQCKPQGSP